MNERTPLTPNLSENFRRLFSAHYEALWRCARHLGVSPGDTDDVIQEVFIIALRRYAAYEDRERERAWLFAILRNVKSNYLRGRTRRQTLLSAFAAQHRQRAPVPDEVDVCLHTHLGLRLFSEFLDELGEDSREAFVLSKVAEMSSREIARTLGHNINTVQSRLRNAERAFSRHFGQDSHRAQLLSLAKRERPGPEARRETWTLLAGLSSVEFVQQSRPASHGVVATSSTRMALGELVLGIVTSLATVVVALVIGHGLYIESKVALAPAHRALPPPLLERAPEPSRGAGAAVSVELDDVVKPIEVRPADEADAEHKRARAMSPPRDSNRAGRQVLADFATVLEARALITAGRSSKALRLLERESAGREVELFWIAATVSALCELNREEEGHQRLHAWARSRPSVFSSHEIEQPCVIASHPRG